MNLTLHQFRKDLRQFRGLMVAWWGVLAVDLAGLLGGLGEPRFGLGGRLDPLSRWMADLVPLVVVLMPWLLASLVVLTDSIGRTTGFLATRPLPRRDLCLGKLLFLGLGLVVPVGFHEFTWLLTRGVPGGLLVQGVIERVAYAGLGVLVAAGLASVWSGTTAWVIGLALALLGAGVVGLGWVLIPVGWAKLVGTPDPVFADPTLIQVLAGLGVFAVLSLALAVGVAAWRWGDAGRRWGILLAGGLSVVAALVLPGDAIGPRGEDPAMARRVITPDTVEVPLPRLGIAPLGGGGAAGEERWFGVGLSPRLAADVDGVSVTWWCDGGSWESEDGTTVPLVRGRGRPPVLQPRFLASNMELEAMARDLATDSVWFRGAVYGRRGDTADHVDAGRLALPETALASGAPTRLRLRLGGHVYRWQRVAEMPLTAGASSRGSGEDWTVVKVEGGDGGNLSLALRGRRVALGLTGTSRWYSDGVWPSDRYEFVVHRPGRGEAYLPFSRATVLERAGHSTCRDAYVSVFYPPASSGEETFDGAADSPGPVLVIYRRDYQGSAAVAWDSPSFRWSGADVASSFPVLNRTPLAVAEARRRLERLPAPATEASRDAVGQYVLEVVDLLEAVQGTEGGFEAMAADRLAGWVPAHLDLFLEGAAVLPDPGCRLLRRAMAEGMEGDQRHRLVETLPRVPELAEVVMARGWEEEAAPALRSLLHRPGRLPDGALRALAGLDDPATYDRLLEELEVSADPGLYRVLRERPGIEAGLEQTVRRVWNGRPLRRPQVMSSELEIALLHGIPEALGLLLEDPGDGPPPDPGIQGMTMSLLREVIATDGLAPAERHDDETFRRWLAAHRGEAFTFDRARRQFVRSTTSEEVP